MIDSSREFLLEAIVDDMYNSPAPTITPTKPGTKPSTTPSPSTPKRNPLRPTRPDIRPKPKADSDFIQKEIETFIRIRQDKNTMSFSEASDKADRYPDYIGQKQAAKYNSVQSIESLYPDMTDGEKRYINSLFDGTYYTACDKLAKYLKTTPEEIKQKYPTYPALSVAMSMSFMSIFATESKHKDLLIKLAIDSVLSLEEYSFLKELVDNGDIVLDVKLISPGEVSLQDNQVVENSTQQSSPTPNGHDDDEWGFDQNEFESDFGDDTDEYEDDDSLSGLLSEAEEASLDFVEEFGEASDQELVRQFANNITQGDAVGKMYLFHMVQSELEGIDPELPTKYGICCAIGQLGYFTDFVDIMGGGGGSMVKVEPDANESGAYIIRVRAIFFPMLTHELVKGLNEYLAMDIDQDILDKETHSDEISQIQTGPQLELNLRKLLPPDSLKYFPLVKKLIYQDPNAADLIRKLLLGNNQSGVLMKRLVDKAIAQMDNYSDNDEDYSDNY
jgi:hypothetical protein